MSGGDVGGGYAGSHEQDIVDEDVVVADMIHFQEAIGLSLGKKI